MVSTYGVNMNETCLSGSFGLRRNADKKALSLIPEESLSAKIKKAIQENAAI